MILEQFWSKSDWYFVHSGPVSRPWRWHHSSGSGRLRKRSRHCFPRAGSDQHDGAHSFRVGDLPLLNHAPSRDYPPPAEPL